MLRVWIHRPWSPEGVHIVDEILRFVVGVVDEVLVRIIVAIVLAKLQIR